MKKRRFINIILFTFILFSPLAILAQAGCVLQPPIIKIDFGSVDKPSDINLSLLKNYQRVYNDCPEDGHYAFVASTNDCFGGHWINLNQDHTPGDDNGKMLLVNASYPQGPFFVTRLSGLKPNTKYQLGAWIINVCWGSYNCDPIRPDIRFTIFNNAGKELARFATGQMPPPEQASWLQYSAFFTTPAEGEISLKMDTRADGGCGNDFAVDDITISECIVPTKIVKEKPPVKPVVFERT